MRWKQSFLVIALCAVALLSAAYFGLRSRPPHAASHVTPVVGQAGASKRAGDSSVRAGNAPARVPAAVDWSDSFREQRQCFYASRELAVAKAVADCKPYEAKPQFEQAYAECLNGSMDARKRIAAAEAVLSGCGNVGDVQRRYYEATKAAAQQGDADAKLCFLEFEFGSDTSLFTGADVEEYENVAPGYVAEAFERGDWRIVYLLARRRFHPGSGPITGLDQMGQPETIYRMRKLLRLGASGSYAKGLDGALAGLTLPQDGIREADAWAYETYVKYFSGVPGLTEAPTVCSGLPSPG